MRHVSEFEEAAGIALLVIAAGRPCRDPAVTTLAGIEWIAFEVAGSGRLGHDGRVKDWVAWHAAYDDPSSPLSARLRCVRSHLRDAIDQAPPGRVSLVSLCAGQGHDVIGVLPRHPRRDDVRAVLVESDERNADQALPGRRRAGPGPGRGPPGRREPRGQLRRRAAR